MASFLVIIPFKFVSLFDLPKKIVSHLSVRLYLPSELKEITKLIVDLFRQLLKAAATFTA